jgi:hypothetical protein
MIPTETAEFAAVLAAESGKIAAERIRLRRVSDFGGIGA